MAWCLNENPDHPLSHALDKQNSDTFLESDVDHQLLLNIPFKQRLAIHCLKISTKGDPETAPAFLRIFVNNADLDFDEAEGDDPTFETLLPLESVENNVIELPAGKFQSVESLQIFVEENYGAPVTRIHYLDIVGVR
mmetsp:Transcript_115789/g.180961  ORF Transcript_115789/g.180961 Transcript_115789/m.180961 type:complete len:137 (-) Transcript_115789:109-519(-)